VPYNTLKTSSLSPFQVLAKRRLLQFKLLSSKPKRRKRNFFRRRKKRSDKLRQLKKNDLRN